MELVCHSQEALGEDEKKDYLYVVVDKANKKKIPPQKNKTGTLFCLVVCAFFWSKLNTQLFTAARKICNAKGTESKRAGKKERKEARKKIRNG